MEPFPRSPAGMVDFPRSIRPDVPPMNRIEQQDPEVWAAIDGEIGRQRGGLEMIASENYTSTAVMQACGSVLTNKYAEGYPRRRYWRKSYCH